jgi:hypothetical protein
LLTGLVADFDRLPESDPDTFASDGSAGPARSAQAGRVICAICPSLTPTKTGGACGSADTNLTRARIAAARISSWRRWCFSGFLPRARRCGLWVGDRLVEAFGPGWDKYIYHALIVIVR